MERHSRRHQRFVAAAGAEQGQATVEFAIVTAAFLSVAAALGALWRALDSGLLVQHALAVASHHIQAVAPATIVDLFLY